MFIPKETLLYRSEHRGSMGENNRHLLTRNTNTTEVNAVDGINKIQT